MKANLVNFIQPLLSESGKQIERIICIFSRAAFGASVQFWIAN